MPQPRKAKGQSPEEVAEQSQEERDEERRREITASAKNASGGTAGDELLPGSEAREAKLRGAKQDKGK